MSTYVRYSSNNSGGSWWLDDVDWRALEAAGWEVEWVRNDPYHNGAERWLGRLATSAKRRGLDYDAAIAEFERVTGQNAHANGCDCCGPPHNFYEENDEADT